MKKAAFLFKTFFAGLFPFCFVSLFAHLKKQGGIDFSLNFIDLLNVLNFLLFFYVKKKLRLKKRQKKEKEALKNQQVKESRELSIYQNTTMTQFWIYDSFYKNMNLLEVFINNVLIYFATPFLFVYFIIKKAESPLQKKKHSAG